MSTVTMPPERRQAVEPPDADISETPETFDVLSVAVLISKRLRFLLIGALVSAVVVAGLSLLMDNEYTTRASFMPQTSKDDLTSAMGGMGITGALASFGLSSGGEISPKFYADLVTSDHVLLSVLDSTTRPYNYVREFKLKAKSPERLREKAIKHLRSHITVDFEPRTSVTTIQFRGDSPKFAVLVMQAILQAVNDFNVHTLQTTARARTKFLEGRVTEADSLRGVAQATLRRFMIENRSYAQSPGLQLRQQELQQDFELANERLLTLSSSLDRARLDEVRDTPVLTTLDLPLLPGDHSSPHRSILTIVAPFVWLTLACGWIAMRAAIDSARRRRAADFAELKSSWRRALPLRAPERRT